MNLYRSTATYLNTLMPSILRQQSSSGNRGRLSSLNRMVPLLSAYPRGVHDEPGNTSNLRYHSCYRINRVSYREVDGRIKPLPPYSNRYE